MATLGQAILFIRGDDKGLQSTLKGSERAAQASGKRMAGGFNAILGGAVGGLVGGAALAGINALVGAVQSGFSAVRSTAIDMNASLESTTLQFTTLMGDADMAADHVANLFKLAAETPFETGPIIEASKHLQVFGGAALNTEDNLRMVGDAAAAVNADIADIGFWVGRAYSAIQMGKPFGEAAMRLQELGVMSPRARAEMERLQKAGASASEVWGVLTGDMDRFTGAMKLQAGRWNGLTSSIRDAVSILGSTALKPLFDMAKQAATALNDLLQSDAAKKWATDAAKWLGDTIVSVRNMVQGWINGFGAMDRETAATAGRIMGWIAGIAHGAAVWGIAIVENLAAGIRLALAAVGRALGQLGALFAKWLKPGSPPKLLPELQDWGKAAAEVYLEGWTQADFSALTRLGSRIQSLMQSMADVGQIGELDVGPMLLAVRQAIANAIGQLNETGEIGAEAFAAIREAAGAAGAEVEALARRQLALLQIDKQLKALQGERQANLDAQRIAELNAIMADPRATKAQKDRAANELKEIGLLQERAQAEEELAKLENRIDIQTETLRLYEAQNRLIESLRDAIAGIGDSISGALEPLQRQLETYQIQQDELADLIRLQELQAVLEDDTATAAEKMAAQLEIGAINTERAMRALRAKELGVDLGHLQKVPITLEDIGREGTGAAEGMGALGEAGKGVADALADLEKFSLDLSPIQDPIDAMKVGFEEGKSAAEELFGIAPGNESPILQGLRELTRQADEARLALEGVNEAAQAGSGGGGTSFDGIPVRAAEVGTEAGQQFSSMFGQSALAGVEATGNSFSAQLGRALSGAADRVLPDFNTKVEGFLRNTLFKSVPWDEIGGGLKTGLATQTAAALLVWTSGLQRFIDEFKRLFRIQSPSGVMLDLASDVMQGFIDGIAGRVADMVATAAEAWEQFKTTIGTKLDELHTLIFDPEEGWGPRVAKGLEDTWNGIRDTTERVWKDIKETIKQPINQIIRWINKLIDGYNTVGSKIGLPALGKIDELASGTRNFPGGLAIVGERGPELVALPQGAQVWPAGETQRMLGVGAGPQPATVMVTGNTFVVRNDEDIYKVARQVSALIQRRSR